MIPGIEIQYDIVRKPEVGPHKRLKTLNNQQEIEDAIKRLATKRKARDAKISTATKATRS